METSKIYNKRELIELLNLDIPEKESETLRRFFFVKNKLSKDDDLFKIFYEMPDDRIFGRAYMLQICHSNNKLPQHILDIINGD